MSGLPPSSAPHGGPDHDPNALDAHAWALRFPAPTQAELDVERRRHVEETQPDHWVQRAMFASRGPREERMDFPSRPATPRRPESRSERWRGPFDGSPEEPVGADSRWPMRWGARAWERRWAERDREEVDLTPHLLPLWRTTVRLGALLCRSCARLRPASLSALTEGDRTPSRRQYRRVFVRLMELDRLPEPRPEQVAERNVCAELMNRRIRTRCRGAGVEVPLWLPGGPDGRPIAPPFPEVDPRVAMENADLDDRPVGRAISPSWSGPSDPPTVPLPPLRPEPPSQRRSGDMPRSEEGWSTSSPGQRRGAAEEPDRATVEETAAHLNRVLGDL